MEGAKAPAFCSLRRINKRAGTSSDRAKGACVSHESANGPLPRHHRRSRDKCASLRVPHPALFYYQRDVKRAAVGKLATIFAIATPAVVLTKTKRGCSAVGADKTS